MLCPVAAFREEDERYVVLQCLDNDFLSVIVLEYIAKTVPSSYHRKDAEEVHQIGNKLLLENVCAGAEYLLFFSRAQDYQCVHQCVAVIRADDDGSVSRNIFLADNLCLTVTVLDFPVYPECF